MKRSHSIKHEEDKVPNVMGVLRAEIRRLARKETRQEIATLRKYVNSMRRRMAESRRRIQDLEHRAKQMGKGMGAKSAPGEEEAKQVRFSPTWVKRHRSKLGMSRRIYAKLVGVSPQTIMGWESGRTRPRRSALRMWRGLREMGIRELKALVGGGGASKRRAARKRQAAGGRRARRKISRKGRRVVSRRTARRARGKAARGGARRIVRRKITRRRGIRARAKKK